MKLMIIDINGIGYGTMYVPSFAKLSYNGKPTGAIHGTISSVLKICSENTDFIPVVLWDGHSEWRREIYPEYKANRSDDPKKVEIKQNYKSQIPSIKALLESYGICQIEHPTLEADDIGGIIVRNLPKDVEIVLVCDDTDWWQTLQENTSWYSQRSGRMLELADLSDPEKCPEGPFLNTEEYVKAKALAGDSSDNIDGVPDVGLKTGVKFLRTYGSIEEMWRQHDEGVPIKGKVANVVAGLNFRDTYLRNLKLVDWKAAPTPDLSSLSIKPGKRDMVKFNEIATSLGLSATTNTAKNRIGTIIEASERVPELQKVFDAIYAETGEATIRHEAIQANRQSISSEKEEPQLPLNTSNQIGLFSETTEIPHQKESIPNEMDITIEVAVQAVQAPPSAEPKLEAVTQIGESKVIPVLKENPHEQESQVQSSKLGNELANSPPKILKRKFPF